MTNQTTGPSGVRPSITDAMRNISTEDKLNSEHLGAVAINAVEQAMEIAGHKRWTAAHIRVARMIEFGLMRLIDPNSQSTITKYATNRSARVESEQEVPHDEAIAAAYAAIEQQLAGAVSKIEAEPGA